MSDRRTTVAPVLLFADDESSGSDLAWLWINCHRWDGWELHVASARPVSPGGVVGPDASTLHPSTDRAWRPTFTEAGFRNTDFLVAEGDPRVVLSEYPAASLVVLGPAGDGLGRWRVGSTTEYLIHHPPAPLLVARNGRPVRRALVCADGSPHAESAATAFASLPFAASVETFVLAVDDGRTDLPDAVERITDALHPAVVPADVRCRTGRPHEAIVEEARSDNIDLIVLGTRGFSTLRRLTLGSTASAIVRSGVASVLVHQGAEPLR